MLSMWFVFFNNIEFRLKALQNSKKIDSMVFNTTFAKYLKLDYE